MGVLRDHDVAKLVSDHRLAYFVETGTWRGDGILHALREAYFTRSWTVESNPSLAVAAAARLEDEGFRSAAVLVGDSAGSLDEPLAFMQGAPCLWWLDAHLPERYEGAAHAGEQRLPLEAELRVIVTHARDHSRDVFICDDWRLYEARPYASGNFPGGPPGDSEAVRTLLSPTHALHVDHRREGYLVALPARDAKKPSQG